MYEKSCHPIPALRLILAAAIVLPMALAAPASAHDAPTGWKYPYKCCSGYDCRPVKTSAVSEGPDGYVIENTGETVGYTDRRIELSPDGEFHWCSKGGRDDTATICLFVPARMF